MVLSEHEIVYKKSFVPLPAAAPHRLQRIQRGRPAYAAEGSCVHENHIDIYSENLRNEAEPPGFQSLEREGMEQLLAQGLTDVFRAWYPRQVGNLIGKKGLSAMQSAMAAFRRR